MRIQRFLRHARMNPIAARRAFPPATIDAIQREIAALERRHRGQLMFVVEAELTSGQLWRGLTSRERARELFALHGVWNTEENNGILVYVLLADRKVEIVADRGVDARVGSTEWEAICRMMERHFADARFEEGAIAGVRSVSGLLERHFPGAGAAGNELPDRPLLI